MNTLIRVLMGLFVVLMAGCGGQRATVPPFVAQQLGNPAAQVVTLQLDERGTIKRWAVRMEHQGMPDWIFSTVDRRVGPGEDLGYYIAEYADGDRTYDVTRRLDNGRVVELSVRDDHRIRHLERELGTDEIPGQILAAIETQRDFVPSGYEVRDLADGEITYAQMYFVRGERDGRPTELLVSPDGVVVGSCRKIETELTVVSSLSAP